LINTGRIQLLLVKRAHDVAEWIENLISSCECGVGRQLPSEKQMMKRFGVGRPVVGEEFFLMSLHDLVGIVSGKRIPPSGWTIATRLQPGRSRRSRATRTLLT
jgi:hypothetical protein